MAAIETAFIIEKLSIENFRQFESLELTLDERLTVLIAENGGGKTTILDCLAGTLTYLVQNILYQEDPKPFIETDVRIGQEDFKVNLNLGKALSDFELTANYTLRGDSVRFGTTGVKEVRIDEETVQPYDFSNWLGEWNRVARLGQLNLPVVAYYPCAAASLPSSNGKNGNGVIHNIFQTYAHSLDGQSLDFDDLKKWLIWQYNQEREGELTETRIFEAFKQVLVGKNGILNDTDKQPFTDMRVSFKKEAGNLVFIKEGIALPDTLLSSGEKTLMVLFADLARRLVIANHL
jgi:predicted ATP-binding protein involved in virulence